jgi:threonine dehydrogenase-like Zn-dependent dehydrogenase
LRDGAHAQVLRLPARNLLRVPEGVSDEQAVFVEPLAAAFGVLERCPMAAGTHAAVIGDGKLGLLCAMVLKAAGVSVVLVGKHAHKLGIAARRGVETVVVNEAAALGGGLDVVVEASGEAAGFSTALDLLRPGGSLVLKSTFHGETPVDTSRVVVNEIRVVGSRCGRFAPALDMLSRGAIDVAPLVSEVFALTDGAHAMRVASTAGILKVLLRASA